MILTHSLYNISHYPDILIPKDESKKYLQNVYLIIYSSTNHSMKSRTAPSPPL